MARIRIGDMLVKAGLIDEMQLNAALSQQRQWGGRIGDILVDKGFLDEMMLWKGLSKQLGVQLVSLPALTIPRDLVNVLPRELCERYEIFPTRREDRQLTVATSDPNNVGALDEVAFRTGLKLKVVLAPQREIEWAIRHYYDGDPARCPPPRQRFRPELAGELQIMPDARTDRDDPSSSFATRMGTTPPSAASAAGQPAGPGLPSTWQPPVPGGAPPMRTPSLPPMDAGGDAEAHLRETTQLLKLIIDVCVARGIFTREEYIERLRRLG